MEYINESCSSSDYYSFSYEGEVDGLKPIPDRKKCLKGQTFNIESILRNKNEISNLYEKHYEETTNKLFSKLNEISEIIDNWDGFGAVKPSKKCINNVTNIFRRMELKNLARLSFYDINPSPYGTVEMEWKIGLGIANIEVGDNLVSITSEFPDGRNIDLARVDISEKNSFENTIEEFEKILKLLKNVA